MITRSNMCLLGRSGHNLFASLYTWQRCLLAHFLRQLSLQFSCFLAFFLATTCHSWAVPLLLTWSAARISLPNNITFSFLGYSVLGRIIVIGADFTHRLFRHLLGWWTLLHFLSFLLYLCGRVGGCSTRCRFFQVSALSYKHVLIIVNDTFNNFIAFLLAVRTDLLTAKCLNAINSLKNFQLLYWVLFLRRVNIQAALRFNLIRENEVVWLVLLCHRLWLCRLGLFVHFIFMSQHSTINFLIDQQFNFALDVLVELLKD
jgi:hypothetical protein